MVSSNTHDVLRRPQAEPLFFKPPARENTTPTSAWIRKSRGSWPRTFKVKEVEEVGVLEWGKTGFDAKRKGGHYCPPF